jgi:hypothetical protein
MISLDDKPDEVSQLTIGMSYRRVVTVPNPGAGKDWSLTVPGGVAWRVRSLYAILQTSAAVANRVPSITIGDGSKTFFTSPVYASLVASGVYTIAGYAGFSPNNDGLAARPQCLTLPTEILDSGYIIGTQTQGLQSADVWAYIQMLVTEYRIGPPAPQNIVRDIAIGPQ